MERMGTDFSFFVTTNRKERGERKVFFLIFAFFAPFAVKSSRSLVVTFCAFAALRDLFPQQQSAIQSPQSEIG
jgi:hypothetical protein